MVIRSRRGNLLLAASAMATSSSVGNAAVLRDWFSSVQNKYAEATVIDADPLTADAAATALVVAGPDWPELAIALGLDQALVIDDQERVTRMERP